MLIFPLIKWDKQILTSGQTSNLIEPSIFHYQYYVMIIDNILRRLIYDFSDGILRKVSSENDWLGVIQKSRKNMKVRVTYFYEVNRQYFEDNVKVNLKFVKKIK